MIHVSDWLPTLCDKALGDCDLGGASRPSKRPAVPLPLSPLLVGWDIDTAAALLLLLHLACRTRTQNLPAAG